MYTCNVRILDQPFSLEPIWNPLQEIVATPLSVSGIVLRESFNDPILATERHFRLKKGHVILYNIGHSIVIAVEKN